MISTVVAGLQILYIDSADSLRHKKKSSSETSFL